jgi:AraC family transcriptional regulator
MFTGYAYQIMYLSNKWRNIELEGGRYLVFDAKGPVPESIKKAMQQIIKY